MSNCERSVLIGHLAFGFTDMQPPPRICAFLILSHSFSHFSSGHQEETKAKLDEATAMVESLQEETGEKLRAFKEETSESLGAVQVRKHACGGAGLTTDSVMC